MVNDTQEFIKDIADSLHDRSAAIFAGAGLSKGSGYVDWKELLRDMASAIGLDISKEEDLAAVAQYFVNRQGGRAQVAHKILNEFYCREIRQNDNLEIISRLPIDTIWTTNYDRLIENNLELHGKLVDVKAREEDYRADVRDRDVTLYKMHGDMRSPYDTVLTKDDYEEYEIARPSFLKDLHGHLLTKKFLFIGFSFNDPNLNNILSRLRLCSGIDKCRHYFFVKEVARSDYESEEDYHYARTKQELRIQDLRRYALYAVRVNSYKEINLILENIERHYLSRSVFISGSAEPGEYGAWNGHAESFMHRLSREIVRAGYRVVTGNGKGVGPFVISGCLEHLMEQGGASIDDAVLMRPFPNRDSDSESDSKKWSIYRKSIVREAGTCIFVFGNRSYDGSIRNSLGVRQEFEIAREYARYIIPIGATGYVAKEIYESINFASDEFSYLSGYEEVLGRSTSHDELIGAVVDILIRISHLTSLAPGNAN